MEWHAGIPDGLFFVLDGARAFIKLKKNFRPRLAFVFGRAMANFFCTFWGKGPPRRQSHYRARDIDFRSMC